ncbi:galactose-inhibitable lectin 35 kDa subunit precursor, putative [Entamoeba invadens IP1]|uniref:Galactose-inhibitable lectin 35 kDa subunit, putative n=1 Tax=Entamoeba invadens IP1 TaxID=370355 RepID=A0A0A1U3S5_ENTIV|nr:galactose-inhibitable lectin 35 kDa subunit precursor, putative [Entamoeba invadens IP1]ELP86249.1 galactose-inhibitable lectin 35 kDa subunit precursor, putative [Entamoeba invadens IP1]|eukprot:XP_004185595.1 galactose-inhibitable lectin 35 kDa subunit precursor, putative [Entamoeba invadens IP1]
MLLLLCITLSMSYTLKYPATDYPQTAGNELYARSKCTTCCRVIFATPYNYDNNRFFTDDDYKNGIGRIFVMDMEFDTINQVSAPAGGYEQTIMLRPLVEGRELQYFEFASYKMFTVYVLPRRVHDIRRGSYENNRLIIWSKNPPIEGAPGSDNQRFIYVHPYDSSFYTSAVEQNWKEYKQHFFLRYTTGKNKLCYEICRGNDFQPSTYF